MNLYSQGLLDSGLAFAAAALIGGAFGFVLERAGFGSSRRLTSIFYLRDFAVYQTMFTAVITALLGVETLSALGLVEPSSIHRMATFPVAQSLGGLIFGAGFVIGGWCPGTAMVGLAAGKADALVFLGGAAAGSLAYAAAFPALQETVELGACGVVTLPETLGLAPGLTVVLVVLMAVVSFGLLGAWTRRRTLS